MKLKRPKIICLMGPTASGKTDLAIRLVQTFPCDIVSVDSTMVYRTMDIGSAKPSQHELNRAPHRLIDIRDPLEAYSVADFRRDALREIDCILSKNRIPLLVGGTMLYFKALQEGLSTLPAADEKIREKISKQAAIVGWDSLHDRLKTIDPASAARIHPNDPQRLQRALEVHEITGKPMSILFEEQQRESPYDFINIALLPKNRKWLHERIEKRFRLMLQNGLIDEVSKLYGRGDLSENLPSMRSVGYRQVWGYLEGKYDQTVLLEKGIIATRQLAKRQMTWLRSWANLAPFDCDDSGVVDRVVSYLKSQDCFG